MATITPKEFAAKVDSDPKTVRRFLRSLVGGDNPGKGQRWGIEEDAVEGLAKKFAAYSSRTARVVTIDDLEDCEVDEVEEDMEDEELEEI